jgi:hypothetical protein
MISPPAERRKLRVKYGGSSHIIVSDRRNEMSFRLKEAVFKVRCREPGCPFFSEFTVRENIMGATEADVDSEAIKVARGLGFAKHDDLFGRMHPMSNPEVTKVSGSYERLGEGPAPVHAPSAPPVHTPAPVSPPAAPVSRPVAPVTPPRPAPVVVKEPAPKAAPRKKAAARKKPAAKKAARKPAKKAAKKAAKKGARKAAAKRSAVKRRPAAKKAARKTARKAAKKRPARKASPKAARKTARKPARKAAKKAARKKAGKKKGRR